MIWLNEMKKWMICELPPPLKSFTLHISAWWVISLLPNSLNPFLLSHSTLINQFNTAGLSYGGKEEWTRGVKWSCWWSSEMQSARVRGPEAITHSNSSFQPAQQSTIPASLPSLLICFCWKNELLVEEMELNKRILEQ